MKIKIITLFKEMFIPFINLSIIKRAIEKGLVTIDLIDLREYSNDKHNHVDDTPYGGGNGMVIKVDVVKRCLDANVGANSHIVMTSPRGKKYSQEIANNLAKNEELVILCGHYEGFDERVNDYCDELISIGDYVLTGGEIPAMVIADSVIRLVEGVLTKGSYEDDSFQNGLLEYPQYTRPVEFEGKKVPEVLANGNHEEIRKYRLYESLKTTYLNRPDLLVNRELTKEEASMLDKIKEELK